MKGKDSDDEACPGCVGYYTLNGQICNDCKGTHWEARLKGKKGEKGKGYDSDSDDGKEMKGKKGKGKLYWRDGAICRHPKCLMCNDARRVDPGKGKASYIHYSSCTSCGHTFNGPWGITICSRCAPSRSCSDPKYFPFIEGKGKKGKNGKMDNLTAKKALQSASALSEVYPFNAMGTSRGCDTAVCASCGKSWAKHLTSNLVQSIHYLLKPGDFT